MKSKATVFIVLLTISTLVIVFNKDKTYPYLASCWKNGCGDQQLTFIYANRIIAHFKNIFGGLSGEKIKTINQFMFQHTANNKFDLVQPLQKEDLSKVIYKELNDLKVLTKGRKVYIFTIPDKHLFACKKIYFSSFCNVLDKNYQTIKKLYLDHVDKDSQIYIDLSEYIDQNIQDVYYNWDSHWHQKGAMSLLGGGLGKHFTKKRNLNYITVNQKKYDLAKTVGLEISMSGSSLKKTRIYNIEKKLTFLDKRKNDLLISRHLGDENQPVSCYVYSDSFFFSAQATLLTYFEHVKWKRVNNMRDVILDIKENHMDPSCVIFFRAQKGYSFYGAREM